MTGMDIVGRVKPAVALVLVGEGAGRLTATASAVCVSPDGILLTAYHVVKDAREVQVRLADGEIYDNVQLLNADSRRDVVAIRISATGLPVLPVATRDDFKVGEKVYVISNPQNLASSASSGILSAIRLADDIPGAGQGFHLLQFSAPVSPGSSGGVLVDEYGRALGLITSSLTGQELNFAVPLVNVLGLARRPSVGTSLGPGSNLNLPQYGLKGSSQAVAKANAAEILRSARTVVIQSRTAYFTPALLTRVLLKQPAFSSMGFKVVEDPRVADLIIRIDRPLFTYDFTYTVTSPSTSVELASGKVIAFDGAAAAPKIAKNLIKIFESAHTSEKASKQTH
ncbi:MAG TPA: serine protease [Terriglobia bacterium]|nr:serine protease [Terriglobia bacterium]